MAVSAAGRDWVSSDGERMVTGQSLLADLFCSASGMASNDIIDIISSPVRYGFAVKECTRIDDLSTLRAAARLVVKAPLSKDSGIPRTL